MSIEALDALPRHDLGFFPTPIAPLTRLSGALGGPELWIKRDDQSGLAMGGNKVRKLEYLVAAALERGFDALVTGGAVQSNHCRQTAAAAAATGLDCHLVLGGEPGTERLGNLLLDDLFGATIHWAGADRKGQTIHGVAARLEADGSRPYSIPYGGSNPLGACGFVRAALELEAQVAVGGPIFTHVVFASSSGGTHAGLEVGRALTGADYRLVGVNIDKQVQDEEPFAVRIAALAGETARFLGTDLDFPFDSLDFWDGYTGEGYGIVGALERHAIRTLAEHEGILLDPVYTGRAFGALLDQIRRGQLTRGDNVLFWHTGGTPALFPYASSLV